MAVLIFFIGSDARYTKSEPVIITDTVYQEKTFTKFIKLVAEQGWTKALLWPLLWIAALIPIG